MLGIVVLAVVVFAFVLEPVLRARGDKVVLDAVALPRPPEVPIEDELDTSETVAPEDEPGTERVAADRVALNRPVSSDIS